MNDRTLQVLNLLKESEDYISGEELCLQLGVSRTAVWKYICQLREAGYGIDSCTNRGYQLKQCINTPTSCEVNPLLQTARFGRILKYLENLDSTNAYARTMAEDGAPEGTVVVADSQTGGRGRLDRKWFSPAGVNLYFSLILRPEVSPVQVPQLSLVAGIALCRAIKALYPELMPRAKWPNDVYLGSKKLAGILCTMYSEPERVHYLVVGIGVNVNISPADFPAELFSTATSLRAAANGEVSRPQLLAQFLEEMEKAYDHWLLNGLDGFLSDWDRLSLLNGRKVTVSTLTEELSGVVKGINASGALLLDDGSELLEISGGDVHVTNF